MGMFKLTEGRYLSSALISSVCVIKVSYIDDNTQHTRYDVCVNNDAMWKVEVTDVCDDEEAYIRALEIAAGVVQRINASQLHVTINGNIHLEGATTPAVVVGGG